MWARGPLPQPPGKSPLASDLIWDCLLDTNFSCGDFSYEYGKGYEARPQPCLYLLCLTEGVAISWIAIQVEAGPSSVLALRQVLWLRVWLQTCSRMHNTQALAETSILLVLMCPIQPSHKHTSPSLYPIRWLASSTPAFSRSEHLAKVTLQSNAVSCSVRTEAISMIESLKL